MQRHRSRWSPALLILLLLMPSAAASASLVTDLDEGKQLAAEKNMPLVLEFGAKW